MSIGWTISLPRLPLQQPFFPGAGSRPPFSTADWLKEMSLWQSRVAIGWERSLARLPPQQPGALMAGSSPHDALPSLVGAERPLWPCPKPLLFRQRPESPQRRLSRL